MLRSLPEDSVTVSIEIENQGGARLGPAAASTCCWNHPLERIKGLLGSARPAARQSAQRPRESESSGPSAHCPRDSDITRLPAWSVAFCAVARVASGASVLDEHSASDSPDPPTTQVSV